MTHIFNHIWIKKFADEIYFFQLLVLLKLKKKPCGRVKLLRLKFDASKFAHKFNEPNELFVQTPISLVCTFSTFCDLSFAKSACFLTTEFGSNFVESTFSISDFLFFSPFLISFSLDFFLKSYFLLLCFMYLLSEWA